MTWDAADRAVALAAELLVESRRRETRAERRRRRRLARLLADPAGRGFTLALTDEVARIRDKKRAARRFAEVVGDQGVPRFAGPLDRVLLRLGAAVAPRLPSVVMPLVIARLRRESAGIILPAEDRPLTRHLARRRAAGIRVNVNVLGEAILGDDEARRRLNAVQAMLARPDVDYVSVKISSLCAQLEVLAFDDEVERIAEPLRALYRTANGKFVNLDMEEYRDLHLTIAVFKQVLDEPEFASIDAGIVLQAYLPDSVGELESLCAWATERHRRSGGRIKVRIVKGANLAMERVDAEVHGWAQAPYATKAEVDANYKRMLDVALDERWRGAVRIGVASHNLFDVAWALTLGDDRVEMEMLEGMAPSSARVVRDRAGGLLLYAPVTKAEDFESAIAYLVRRLDENTAPENFLRSYFDLVPGSPEWVEQEARFRRSLEERDAVACTPRRTPEHRSKQFNEPDIDWSLAANREWINAELASPLAPYGPLHTDVATVDRAVAAGRDAPRVKDRVDLLHRVADNLARHRGDLLHVMAVDAAKTIVEGDPEVSEAIDFARYYAQSVETIDQLERDGLVFEPYRLTVVAAPWNFPLSIPAGGVLAALAAGSAVILKPAPETRHTARKLAECCWEAGVPEDLLQFLPCDDDDAGTRLITHEGVDGVILTGAYDTARLFLDWLPSRRLHAETSGKNALVITAAADLDVAAKDLVRSAFGHAGQKCSAASLGILEAPVYDDPKFRRTLRDAVTSLIVGQGHDLTTRMGPLIRPPEGALAHALTHLDPGEEWLVEPERLDGMGYLWRPGVKLGVQPGSMFHLTECFGPVLGLLRAQTLDHAIALQNAVPYGLTAGIHSLDAAETRTWAEHVEAGNLYINRHITGAVVQRQPFGGWKRSSVGPTAKAGGPNYVLTLGRWRHHHDQLPPLTQVADSFNYWWKREFSLAHDPSDLRAESNVLRYRPYRRGVLVHVGPGVPADALDMCRLASQLTGTPLELTDHGRLLSHDVDKLRILGDAPDDLRRQALAQGITVDDNPICGHGRIELLRWLREQSVSETRHRYGNPRSSATLAVTASRLRAVGEVEGKTFPEMP